MSRIRESKRIAKDPFHQQILTALGRHLDPHVFEACMADLLRDDFPGLVPVPGGNDAGMDGAIADGRGEPYPLVCTTGEDVAGNLRENLESFLERGLSSRRVAVATSQELTPPRIRALYRLAGKNGFTLLQVFERSALAGRLRGNTTWSKRLLGLTGAPSALAIVPWSRRPQVDLELRGRAKDLEWLRGTAGDRLVLGLPGSGKTFLFSHLIHDGWPALFLVSDDDTAIANAVRDQQPGIVIVDDAHVVPEKLAHLRRLRTEIQGDFEIVASAWPGARDVMVEAMGSIPESLVHTLGLLPRAQIVEIFYDLDVRPEEEILRDLVSQAGNRPGLAVTIALLWRQGEWQKIRDGSVLRRTLLALFKGLTGEEVADVLAAFSLGGRRGMSVGAVAGFLEIPERDVRRTAANLAAGGVLSEVDSERLAVNPQVLRSALLRQVFFIASPLRLDYRKLLPEAPSFAETVEEILVASACRGVISRGVIPADDLHQLVIQSQSRLAWSRLALLNEEEAHWVLENYPGDLGEVAASLLHQIPRAVLPRMFERTVEPAKTGWSRPAQPISLLSAWVEDLRAGSEELVRRRRMVAASAKKFLLAGGERAMGVQGICIALSPSLHGDSLDPGRGDVLSASRGLLPAETLRRIESIWEEVKEAVQEIDAQSCQHLTKLVRDWHYQYSAGSATDAMEKRDLMRGFAGRILRDLAVLSLESPGLRSNFEGLATEFGISLGLEQDMTFLLLYPGLSSGTHGESAAVQEAQIKLLAAEWAQDAPSIVVQGIAIYEEEAKKSSSHDRRMPDLCAELAWRVDEPEAWLDECLAKSLRGDLAGPFLERIVRDRRDGWEDLLHRSLATELLQWRAATLVLTRPEPPSALFQRVVDDFPDVVPLVQQLCQSTGKVPVATLSRLLRHSRWDTALAAAVGEWWAEPQGIVREEVLSDWHAAVLRSRTEEYPGVEQNVSIQYLLRCILSSDASLAMEWLRNRLRDPDLPQRFLGDSPFAHALRSLGREQRLTLLHELQPVPLADCIVPLLVRDEVEVYREVLAVARLSDHHLAPLRGLPGTAWRELALAAVQADYDPIRIAEAAFAVSHTIIGSGIDHWKQWLAAFAEVERQTPGLREVARYGQEIARRELERSQELEHRIDLHGLVGGLTPRRRGDP